MGMGLIGSMIAGAAVGGGKAGEEIGGEFIKGNFLEELKRQEAEIQALRDARLSEMKKVEYRAQKEEDVKAAESMLPIKKTEAQQEGDVKVDVANRSPRTLAPGASEVVGGKITMTAPEKPGMENYYLAAANRFNAEADAIREGQKYAKKGEKPLLPNVKAEKDAEGNLTLLDQNSGAIGVIRPGEAAKEGKSHWFWPDEPGKPAGMPKIEWSLNGQPVELTSLYPSLSGRAPEGAGATPIVGTTAAGKKFSITQEALQAAADDPKKREAMETALGKNQVSTLLEHLAKYPGADLGPESERLPPGLIMSKAAVVQPIVQTTPSQDDIGSQVDALKMASKAAADKLAGYGLQQRRRDPAGYEEAKKAAEEARAAFDAAMVKYQNAMGAIGAVAGRAYR